jgi:hypothetical protein
MKQKIVKKKKVVKKGFCLLLLAIVRDLTANNLSFRPKRRRLRENRWRKWPKKERRTVYQERYKLRG